MLTDIKAIVKHKHFNTVSTTVLIIIYFLFLYNQIIAIGAGSISPTALVFVVMETIVILLLIMRKTPTERSANTIAWLAALSGTFIPLLLSPLGEAINMILGNYLMLLGGLLAILAYLSLNVSFGLSPALRTVKTSGLYMFIRHPMYLSYYIIYFGYLNLSFSIYNTFIFLGLVFFLTTRIFFEEALLLKDPKYQAYAKEVRYRVIPYIF